MMLCTVYYCFVLCCVPLTATWQELANFFIGADGQSRLMPGFNPLQQHYAVNIGGNEKKLIIQAMPRSSAASTKCDIIVDCVPPIAAAEVEVEMETIKTVAIERNAKGERVYVTQYQQVPKQSVRARHENPNEGNWQVSSLTQP